MTSPRGFGSIYETLLRRFSGAMHFLTLLPFYALIVSCIGLSIAPGILLLQKANAWSSGFSGLARAITLGFAAGGAYLAYGFTLIFVVPAMNFLLRARLRPWRGSYYSLATVRWYVHNGLAYVVRFTFLEAITPTPFNTLYFRLMGMKVGRGVQFNSAHISDPSLIEIGNKVTIGGSAVIIGHYGVGGYLILSQVKIGDGATIGLRAIVMGGSQIGAGARVLPNSVVLPKTVIPPGETWGGVPARKIETRSSRDDDGFKNASGQ